MDEKFQQRLFQIFLVEAGEYLQSLEDDLLALERSTEPDRSDIEKKMLRTAHSLKGAAGAVNVKPVEDLAHELENILISARDSGIRLDPEVFNLLFQATDAIKEVIRQLPDGAPFTGLLPDDLLACLRAISGQPSSHASTVESPLNDGMEIAPSEAAPFDLKEELVRVSSARLDRMVALGGELLVARRRLELHEKELQALQEQALRCRTKGPANHDEFQKLTKRVERVCSGFKANYKAVEQIAAPLESEIMHARMMLLSEAFAWIPRAVRDLAESMGKKIDVSIETGDLEIDRSVVQILRDPLLHLVRNAVDHGIEAPDERAAVGKPAVGRLTLMTQLHAGRVKIDIKDDGRGFDTEAIRQYARRRGLAVPDSDQDIIDLAFQPGFSTTPDVTTISGRGIGLDAVKSAVESNGGSVQVDTDPGKGTCFTLEMPLNLSRIQVLMIRTADQFYAIDYAFVQELIRIRPDDISMIQGQPALPRGETPVPVVHLDALLGGNNRPEATEDSRQPVVIIGTGKVQAAFLVDELLDLQDVVILNLGDRLQRVQYLGGATILGNGQLALILNAMELVRAAYGGQRPAFEDWAAPAASRPLLLIVEDTVTTRVLMENILVTAGFEVITAVDGMEALRILQDSKVDLIVTDVEMPRMDGFRLTRKVRASKQLQDLPIILLTALKNERDRMEGLEAGANAYLLKNTFDQAELIDTIKRML